MKKSCVELQSFRNCMPSDQLLLGHELDWIMVAQSLLHSSHAVCESVAANKWKGVSKKLLAGKQSMNIIL